MRKYYKSENVYVYRKLLDGTATLDIKYVCGDVKEITKEEFKIAKENNIFNEYENLEFGAYTVEQYQSLVLDAEGNVVNSEFVYVRNM